MQLKDYLVGQCQTKIRVWLQGDMVSKEDGCIQMRVEHVFKMMEEMREK